MKRSHQAMFNRAFERIYRECCEMGMPPQFARELATDAAWSEYEQYCDQKLEGLKDDGKLNRRHG